MPEHAAEISTEINANLCLSLMDITAPIRNLDNALLVLHGQRSSAAIAVASSDLYASTRTLMET